MNHQYFKHILINWKLKNPPGPLIRQEVCLAFNADFSVLFLVAVHASMQQFVWLFRLSPSPQAQFTLFISVSILQSHPGTNVTVIDLFDRSASLQPMWKQVEGFKAAIYPIMQNAADGVHFICYSQGLWARLSCWNKDINVVFAQDCTTVLVCALSCKRWPQSDTVFCRLSILRTCV